MAISVVPDASSMSLTFLTNPFLSAFVATIFLPLANYSVLLLLHWVGQYLPLCSFFYWGFILSTLKCCKNFFSASTPKPMGDVLHPSPVFMTIHIWCSKNSR